MYILTSLPPPPRLRTNFVFCCPLLQRVEPLVKVGKCPKWGIPLTKRHLQDPHVNDQRSHLYNDPHVNDQISHTCTCIWLSMAYMYYAYDSTSNLLSLGSTALIHVCISNERCCKEELYGVGNFDHNLEVTATFLRVNWMRTNFSIFIREVPLY